MEIEYFGEFVEVSRCGSYTMAAKNLQISQSVLSKHIKRMESELGVPLFVRKKSGIELSEYGLLFFPFASQILDIKVNYEEALLSQSVPGGGYLKIASIPATHQIGVVDLVSGFYTRYPNIIVNILEEETEYLLECLARQEVDIVFARGNAYDPELVRISYMKDHMIAAVSENHPLAKNGKISLLEISREEIFVPKMTHFGFLQLQKACEKAGLTLNITYTNDGGGLWRLVEKGMGIAIVNQQPTLLNRELDQKLVYLDIDPIIDTTLYIYYHPQNITAVAENFINYVIEEKKLKRREML